MANQRAWMVRNIQVFQCGRINGRDRADDLGVGSRGAEYDAGKKISQGWKGWDATGVITELMASAFS
jgi:hypothetical protein